MLIELEQTMDARRAVLEIAEIQERLSSVQTFRGYRSLTVGATGVLAICAAGLQPMLVPSPVDAPLSWLGLWVFVAAAGALGVGGELWWRCRRAESSWFVRLTVSAVSRFLPCMVAGGALTAVLVVSAPDVMWMLPGLWAMLFSLGVWSSCPVMPREIGWVGVFYLIAGVMCLMWGRGELAFAPELMGGTFGVGQLLTAAILYWRLERAVVGGAGDE